MDVQLSVSGGNSMDDLVALRKWLAGERDLQGKVRIVPGLPGETELGGAIEVLTVALGSGGTGVALTRSLTAWLSSRRSDVKVILRSGDHCVELEARRASDAQALIAQLLADCNER